MRCLEQSVGTEILCGGILSWSRRMLHPLLCPLTWYALFLHGGRNPKSSYGANYRTALVTLCSVPVTPLPHGLPAPWVKLLRVRAGVLSSILFSTQDGLLAARRSPAARKTFGHPEWLGMWPSLALPSSPRGSAVDRGGQSLEIHVQGGVRV